MKKILFIIIFLLFLNTLSFAKNQYYYSSKNDQLTDTIDIRVNIPDSFTLLPLANDFDERIFFHKKPDINGTPLSTFLKIKIFDIEPTMLDYIKRNGVSNDTLKNNFDSFFIDNINPFIVSSSLSNKRDYYTKKFEYKDYPAMETKPVEESKLEFIYDNILEMRVVFCPDIGKIIILSCRDFAKNLSYSEYEKVYFNICTPFFDSLTIEKL
jgi:hypothetical protein